VALAAAGGRGCGVAPDCSGGRRERTEEAAWCRTAAEAGGKGGGVAPDCSSGQRERRRRGAGLQGGQPVRGTHARGIRELLGSSYTPLLAVHKGATAYRVRQWARPIKVRLFN
jgi:hypothetical protein